MAYTRAVAEIPLGSAGLHGSRNTSLVPIQYLVEATNLTYVDGTLQKEPGAALYTPTPITGAPRILGGWDHSTNALAQRMIIGLSDGTLRKDSGSGTFATTLKSGLSTSMVPFFVEAGKETAGQSRRTFIFTGTNVVQMLLDDAATTTDLTTPPADWASSFPTVGALHEGRLWGAGNSNDPHRVYYSQPGDHGVFTGAGSGTLPVYPGEGNKIVGMMSYKGLLLLWKAPRGVYYIDTSSTSTTDWRPVRVTIAVGAQSPHTITQLDEDIIFFDATGALQSMAAVQEFGDVAGRNISQIAQMDSFIRRTINLARLNVAQSVYYPAMRELHICCSSAGATINNRRLVVDFNEAAPRFRLSDRDVAESIWLFRDANGIQRPIIGDNIGQVWRLDQPTRSKNGLGYLGQARTAPTDLSYIAPGIGHKNKYDEFIEVYLEAVGNYPVLIDIFWDDAFSETLAFTQSTGGAVFGSIIFDTSQFGADGLLVARRRLTGGGKRIAINVRNNGAGETFSLVRVLVSFNVADEE